MEIKNVEGGGEEKKEESIEVWWCYPTLHWVRAPPSWREMWVAESSITTCAGNARQARSKPATTSEEKMRGRKKRKKAFCVAPPEGRWLSSLGGGADGWWRGKMSAWTEERLLSAHSWERWRQQSWQAGTGGSWGCGWGSDGWVMDRRMNTAFQTPPADSQTACWYSPLAASRSDGASATSFSPFHYRRPLGWFRHRGAQEVAGKAEGCCSRACFAVLFFCPVIWLLLLRLHSSPSSTYVDGNQPTWREKEMQMSRSLTSWPNTAAI